MRKIIGTTAITALMGSALIGSPAANAARDPHLAVRAVQITRPAAAPKGSAIGVQFGVATPIAGYYEYNTGTCAEISPGSWTLSGKPPKHGAISNTTEPYTSPPDGPCPGTMYTLGVVDYTWTDAKAKKKHDKFTADWQTPDGEFDIPYSAKIKLLK